MKMYLFISQNPGGTDYTYIMTCNIHGDDNSIFKIALGHPLLKISPQKTVVV